MSEVSWESMDGMVEELKRLRGVEVVLIIPTKTIYVLYWTIVKTLEVLYLTLWRVLNCKIGGTLK